jgi:hypothetical protein
LPLRVPTASMTGCSLVRAASYPCNAFIALVTMLCGIAVEELFSVARRLSAASSTSAS